MRASQTVRDSTQAELTVEIAWRFSQKNQLDSSFHYAQRALELAQEANEQQVIAYSLSVLGNYYKWKEEYDSSQLYLKQSLAVRMQYGDIRDIASGYNNLALAYCLQEKYDSATHCFEQGLALAEQHDLVRMRGTLFNGLGLVKLEEGSYSEAASFLQASLESIDSSNLAAAKRYQNLGAAYFQLDRPSLANAYFDRAERIYVSIGDSLGVVDLSINRAVLHLQKGAFNLAIRVLQEALDQSLTYGYLDNQSRILHSLGKAHLALGEFREAQLYLNEAREIARAKGKEQANIAIGLDLINMWLAAGDNRQASDEIQAIDPLVRQTDYAQLRWEFLALQAHIFAEQGNFREAYATRLQAQHIGDSLNRFIDQAQALTSKNERMQRERALLQKENELQRTKIEQQETESRNQNLILLVLIVLLFGGIGYLLMRNRNIRIRSRALADKKKSDEKLQQVLHQIDLQLLETQMEANNATSVKIGQDLHDNLGSKLAVVQMSMDGIRAKLSSRDQDVAERFDEVEQLLEESCEDLRTISHDLQDRELKKRGLVKEIEQYVKLINQAEGLRVHFLPQYVPQSMREEAQKEIIALARLLLENVFRHAQAEDVSVKLLNEPDEHFALVVEDNGIGFHPDQQIHGKGRGLTNARMRAEKLGGRFTIISKPGLGTKATVHIHLDKVRQL